MESLMQSPTSANQDLIPNLRLSTFSLSQECDL